MVIQHDHSYSFYFHQISYSFLQTEKITGNWRDKECSEQIQQSIQYTNYQLDHLEPDTTYKIELRAHNAIGDSSPAQIKVRTARGENEQYLYITDSNISCVVKVNYFCFYFSFLVGLCLCFEVIIH